MLSLYKQAVIENLINDIKEYHLNYKTDVGDSGDKELRAKVIDGTIHLPIIAVTETRFELSDNTSDYSNNQISELCEFSVIENNTYHQKLYDYINTMPMMISFDFTILTLDISHTVELEKLISEKYCNSRKIYIQNPNNTNETIPFEIKIDNEIDIKRSQNEKSSMLQSIISLKCITYIPSISLSYHPAQIQFDKELQMSILDDLKTLYSLHNIFSSISNVSDVQNKLENIKSAQENLCGTFDIPLSYGQDKNAVHQIHTIMSSENCNINTAIEKFKQQLKEHEEADKKEAERISKVEEKFSGTDDLALNHYTDAIIEDLKKRLSIDYPISIFGGSSFLEYFIQREKDTLTYPNILIYTETDFTFSYKNYTNKNVNGKSITHNYTIDTLPIEYGIKIEISAKDDEAKKDIEKKIMQIYTNEIQLQVKDYKFQNEIHSLSLSINSDKILRMKETFDNKDYCIYKAFITFNKCQSVYYQTEYNLPDISKNQRLQARLFQLAEFYYMCEYNIRNEAIRQLKLDYKNLFPERVSKKKSLLSMAFGELGNIYNEVVSALNSQEYKTLRASIERGEPINKELFDKALNQITKVYPNLYDKTMQGWTIEQIQEDLDRYANLFNQKWNQICNLLAVLCVSMFTQLEMSGNENKLSEKIHKGLLFYSKHMLNTPELSITDCKKLYDEELRYQEQKRREAEAAFDELRDSVRESRGNNSSGGFLSSMLSTAAGVALGNSSSKKEMKKQTKLMQEQADRERKAASRRKFETNYKRHQIIEENQKRRKKGLPELPIPPGDWS